MLIQVEQPSRGLQEASRARGHVGAVEVAVEVEPQRSPGTAGQLSQELAVKSEKDPEPLGDGEDHLTVGDILEQLTLCPVHPQTSDPPSGMNLSLLAISIKTVLVGGLFQYSAGTFDSAQAYLQLAS